MGISKKLCINEKSRIYDMKNFQCHSESCKTFELALRIINDPLVRLKKNLNFLF